MLVISLITERILFNVQKICFEFITNHLQTNLILPKYLTTSDNLPFLKLGMYQMYRQTYIFQGNSQQHASLLLDNYLFSFFTCFFPLDIRYICEKNWYLGKKQVYIYIEGVCQDFFLLRSYGGGAIWPTQCCVLLFYYKAVCVSRQVTSDSLQPHGLQPDRLLCPGNSPSKNTGVGCHSLLQRNFQTQGSNPGLLPRRQILYRLSYRKSTLRVNLVIEVPKKESIG